MAWNIKEWFTNSLKTNIDNNLTFNNRTIPELWGNSYFYKLQHTTQNNQALIDMYNEIPELQAPVNYIIDSLSTIPYHHYKTKGDNVVLVENSPVIEKLETPNQYQTENDFIKSFFLNRIVLGAGYINYLKSIGVQYGGALFVLPTENTKPVLESLDKDYRLNSVVSYETSFGGSIIPLEKDDVFVQKESTIGSESYFTTRSRLMSAILTSDSLRNNYEARIKLLKDRGATGIIAPTNDQYTLGDAQAKAMRKKFYETTGMTGDKFPFLISPIPTSFTSTSMNADELKLNENKLQDFQTICAVLGVDSSLFENSRATYNNKILAKKNSYESVLIPYMDNYLQLIGNVFGLPEGEFLKADYSNIPALQEDYKAKVEANSKAYNDGITTEAEYREAIGYEGGNDEKKGTGESNQTT